MTGPEHYRMAEKLVAQAEGTKNQQVAATLAEMAQVHATLALAAASAGCRVGDREPAAWSQVLGWIK